MKIALFGINMGPLAEPDAAERVATTAEAAGFESLWAGEHVVLPQPQQPPSPLPPDYPMLDPNITFAFLAAQTRQIRFGTGIIILPQRNPLVLAKELASLDVLTGGRLIFGIGIGYLQAEFQALGIPFQDKAGRTLEYLEAMRAIWNQAQPSYQGKYVAFDDVQAYPRPRQENGPSVVFGGHVPGAFERAITHASGWYGFGLDMDATRDCLAGLRRARDMHTRPAELGELEISVTPRGNIDLQAARAYAELGVDRLILLFPATSDEALLSLEVTTQEIVDYVQRVGDTVVGKV